MHAEIRTAAPENGPPENPVDPKAPRGQRDAGQNRRTGGRSAMQRHAIAAHRSTARAQRTAAIDADQSAWRRRNAGMSR
jgi:hypothetical protein